MSEGRDDMKAALQATVVPVLRSKGFRGSFPHFRRPLPDRIDLLTFQFDKRGNGFVIEISRCATSGVTTHWGKVISPEKVSAWDMHPDKRFRIQLSEAPGTDGWFRFEKGKYEETARSVIPQLDRAEAWWTSAA